MIVKNTRIPATNGVVLNGTGKIYKVKNYMNLANKQNFEHHEIGKSFRYRKLDEKKTFTAFGNGVSLKDGTIAIEVWEDINADMYDKIVLSDGSSGIINADIKVMDELALNGKATFKKFVIIFG